MRVDIHTHAFHPKIAHKVLAQLESHYGIEPLGDGTLEDLTAREKAAGLDRFVVHTAATDPAQVIPANNWSIEVAAREPMALAFGAMHPGFPDPEREFSRLMRHGIRGIKFHADFQSFFLDDPAFYEVVEAAANRFTLMLHVGDTLPPDENPSCPRKVAALHKAFPDTPLIAAHLGGYLHWQYALEHLIGTEVYLDTSSSLPFLDDATLRAIFRRHPLERICFGSDYPLFDPALEIELLAQRLSLSDDSLEKILTNGSFLLAA